MFDIEILEMTKKDLKEGFNFSTQTLENIAENCRNEVAVLSYKEVRENNLQYYIDLLCEVGYLAKLELINRDK